MMKGYIRGYLILLLFNFWATGVAEQAVQFKETVPLMFFNGKTEVGKIDLGIAMGVVYLVNLQGYVNRPNIGSLEGIENFTVIESETKEEVLLKDLPKVILDLSQNDIIELPEALFSLGNIIGLSVSKNKILKIPDSISKLSGLVRLDLSYNKIETIPESLGSLLHLSALYLNNNQLSSIPISLANLKLVSLDLSNNPILEISAKFERWNRLPSGFEGPNQSEFMRLSLPTTLVSSPVDILRLKLSRCESALIPLDRDISTIAHKSPLRTISVVKNISDIPKERLKVSFIHRPDFPGPVYNILDLSYLELTDIEGIDTLRVHDGRFESELVNVPDLILNLSNNNLTVLPESISKLKLQWLIIRDNQLAALPNSIGNLSDLEWLCLSHNNLSSLPSSFTKLNRLKHLYLGDNQFQEITLPASVEVLVLSNNRLGDFYNTDAAPDFLLPSALRALYLNNNHLTSAGLARFRNPRGNIFNYHSKGDVFNYEVIGLQDNKLTTLPFWVGNKLRWLSLEDNTIQMIDEGFFEHANNLAHLDLRNNKLIGLPASFAGLQTLRQANLLGNQKLPILSIENQDVEKKTLSSALHYIEGSHEKRRALSQRLTQLSQNGHLLYFNLFAHVQRLRSPHYLHGRFSEVVDEEINKYL